MRDLFIAYLQKGNAFPAVLLARASSRHARPTNLTSPRRVSLRVCALTSARPVASQLWSASTHERIRERRSLLYLLPTHANRQSPARARTPTLAAVITRGALPRRRSDDLSFIVRSCGGVLKVTGGGGVVSKV